MLSEERERRTRLNSFVHSPKSNARETRENLKFNWKIFVLVFCFIVFSLGFGSATCTYSGSGNWNITSTEDCVNSTILFVDGNITIYGNLTLDGATIIMNVTNNGSVGIYTYPGSKLNIIGGTNITSNESNKRYFFYIDATSYDGDSVFFAKDSFISEAGTSNVNGIDFVSGDRNSNRDINITLDNMTLTKIYDLRFSSVDEYPITITNSYIKTDYRISFEQYTQNAGIILDNNTFVGGSYDGINLFRASDFIIQNNNITLSGGSSLRGGIFMANTVDNITIYNNNISFHATGIHVSDSVNNLNITGNKIFNNTVYGVRMSENTGAVKNITFENNQVYNAGTSCVYLSSNSANAVLNNNSLTNCGLYGFEFNTLSQDWNITHDNAVDNISVYFIGGQNGNSSSYIHINNFYSNTTPVYYSNVTNFGVFNIYNSSYVNLSNINTYYGYNGIEILNSSNIILNNSQAHLATNGSIIGGTGLRIYGGNNSFVYNSSFNGNDYGVAIYYSNHTLLDEVNVTNNRDQIIIKNVEYLNLYNIIVNGGGSQLASLYFYRTSAHGIIENFTSIITGEGIGGILIYGDDEQNETFNNLTFYNINISGPRYGLWFSSNVSNVTFYNSTISSSYGGITYKDLQFGPNNGTVNVSFVNCTYNVSDVNFSQTSDWDSMFYDYKYLNIYVQDSSSNSISSALVNLTNVDNVSTTENTDSNGYVRKTLLSYFSNSAASTNYSNYSLVISKSGYNSNISSFILTSSLDLIKLLSLIAIPQSTATTEQPSSTSTYHPSNSSLEEGYTRNFRKNSKIVVGENTITIKNLQEDRATFEIAGEDYTINEDGEIKIDTNTDGYYDVLVSAGTINEVYATLTVQTIYEEILSSEKESVSEEIKEIVEENKWIWILIGVVGLIILGVVGVRIFGKK